MKTKLSNGKLSKAGFSNQGDWAPIKLNRAFRSPEIRNCLPKTEPVLYLKETITRCNDFSFGEYLVTIVCNQDQRKVEIPLRLLCLDERQKKELTVNGIVPEDYFSEFNENCLEEAYTKPDDSSLLHPEEEEF